VYRQLQRIYDTVAQAPGSASPHEIRRICCRAFQKLYALTSYRIGGWENLPDGPGNVILMNHLSNHVENTLPNRFQLTLDTHFVSAMILFGRYGEPPVRVVRQAEPDEAGHLLPRTRRAKRAALAGAGGRGTDWRRSGRAT